MSTLGGTQTWMARVRRELEESKARKQGAADAAKLVEVRRARREAEAAATTAEHLKAHGVGEREVGVLRAGPDFSVRALAEVREWLKGPLSHLALVGECGTGKTVAGAWAVAQQRFWYQDSELGLCWAWPSTLSESGLMVLAGEAARVSYYGDEAEKLRRRLIRCRLLVLDELGVEVMSSGWFSLLNDVLNQRHRAERRTLLLANLTWAAFSERYGERVADRLREAGKVVSLAEDCVHPARRGQGGAR